MTTVKSPPKSAAAASSASPGTVTTTTAAALAIADMIGIGVFTSLGFQVIGLPSGFTIVALWILGGIVALCGALSYAELATAFPRSGGEYNFLSRTYNRALGFMAGWISATVGFAAPVALAAMTFGKYLEGAVPGTPPLIVALALVWIVTLVQLRGIAMSSRFQNFATYLKVGLIVAFIVAGLLFGPRQPISFLPAAEDLDYIASAPFAIGLVFVMYSYSGWNAVTYISSEVADPKRSLPLSILIAVVVVAALYVALNAVFLLTTPIGEMAGRLEVGLIAGRYIFGEAGSRVAAGLICLGLVSTVGALMWIGPRVTMVMGEDTRALSIFAQRSASGVPANAILLQAVVATTLLWWQNFEQVLDFIQFSLTFCSFLAVLGVIVLRRTMPDLPRPYRVWAFPLTPLIFLAVMLFMMTYVVLERPWQVLASLSVMAVGLLAWAATKSRTAKED